MMRHSNANEVKILAREHPGLYQLIIEDNGTSDERIRPNGEREEYAEKESAGKTGNTRKTENTECSGIGIKNMKKTCPHAGRNHTDSERKWLPDIYYGSKK